MCGLYDWFYRLAGHFIFITDTLCQRDCHCCDDCVMGIACVANSNGTTDALTRHILVASSSRSWCSLDVRRPFCSSLSSISSNLESCIRMKGICSICSQAAYVADLSIGHSLSYGLTCAELSHKSKKEINAGIFKFISNISKINCLCTKCTTK